MPSTDSDGEDEKGRVNLVLPKEQKQKWEQYADEHSVVNSLSALVRMSVENEIQDTANTSEIRDIVRQEVGKQEEKLEKIQAETKQIRAGQLSNDDVMNMVTTATISNQDFSDMIKEATAEGMREREVRGLQEDVLREALNDE